MRLAPLTVRPQPRYPAARRAPSLLGRAVATAAAAAALALSGGCDETWPPGARLAGDIAMPEYFVCKAGELSGSGDVAPIPVPGYFSGTLCGEETALGVFDVVGDGPDLSIALDEGVEGTVIAVLDPDGTEVAEVNPDQPTADLPRIEGRWTLAATPLDPVENGVDWFSGRINLADE